MAYRNFLYDIYRSRGVLVDFGLAEVSMVYNIKMFAKRDQREGTDSSYCICTDTPTRRKHKIESSYSALQTAPPKGYPKDDTRPSRRANRAGTRGFRAPEVLFKCTSQTTKIDIWSAGVIFLTIMSKRFPFFNSTDDIDAMIEIATCYGKKRMTACAQLHGAVFDCAVPTVGEKGYCLERLILWSTCREEDGLDNEERLCVSLLERCLDLDCKKRISAKEALNHEFFRYDFSQNDESEDEMNMVE